MSEHGVAGGLLDVARITATPPADATDLVAVHNAAVGLCQAVLRSKATRDALWDAVDDVVTDQIETGTVSRQAIVDAVVAVLTGGDQ